MIFVGHTLFERRDFLSYFHIKRNVLDNFLSKCQVGYKSTNAYHNSIHASDVMQTCHTLLSVPSLQDKLPPENIFACYIAALIHDYKHPGLNNAFLVSTKVLVNKLMKILTF